jgi:hypothetical protein
MVWDQIEISGDLRYSWNTAKVGVKYQSINQSEDLFNLIDRKRKHFTMQIIILLFFWGFDKIN